MKNTLKEARKHLLASGRQGAVCPCCSQFVKLYKRKFNTVMARGLISLYHLSDGKTHFHHVSAIMTKISPTGSNDFHKLRYYDFIREQVNSDPKKKTFGYWRITQKGIDFVMNKSTVKEYMLIYNTKLKGMEGEEIDIKKALGNKFNYSQLMYGTTT